MPIGIGVAKPSKQIVNHRTVTGTDAETQVTLSTNAKTMMVFNYGTGIAYIGGSGVTTSAYGFWMTPKDKHDFGAVGSGFNFYVILAADDTCTLGVTEDV